MAEKQTVAQSGEAQTRDVDHFRNIAEEKL